MAECVHIYSILCLYRYGKTQIFSLIKDSLVSPVVWKIANGIFQRENKKVTYDRIYKRVGSCLVIPPPKGRKPKGIIKFLGGAFIGAVPEVSYRF